MKIVIIYNYLDLWLRKGKREAPSASQPASHECNKNINNLICRYHRSVVEGCKKKSKLGTTHKERRKSA